MGSKTLKQCSLGISLHFSNDSFMQVVGSPRSTTVPQTLMQLPNSISQPRELERAQVLGAPVAWLGSNPIGQAASLVNALSRSGTK